MTAESRLTLDRQTTRLAVAIAEGTPVAKWASRNGVPERTAYRGGAEPEVRAEVESIRRRAFDEAIGRMASRTTWAVDGIVNLGDTASSDSIKLSALRAVLSDFIAVSKF